MVVVPCRRWVAMTVSASSAVPARRRRRRRRGRACRRSRARSSGRSGRGRRSPRRVRRACPSRAARVGGREARCRSTASRPLSTTPDGPATGAPSPGRAGVRAVRRFASVRRTSVERRSQASSPAPRQPAASPRAAGTIVGRCWKVTRRPTASRSGTKRVSPASARPPPMIRVRGSSRVSAVTRPSASASTAVPPDGEGARVAGLDGLGGVRGVRPAGRRTRRPRRGRPRRRRPASPGSRAARSRTPGPPGRTTMWPISPALPCAPASIRPPMPMAPAMPVPSGDEEEAVGALAGADPAFGEAAGAHVVAEGDAGAVPPSRSASRARIGTSRQPRLAA